MVCKVSLKAELTQKKEENWKKHFFYFLMERKSAEEWRTRATTSKLANGNSFKKKASDRQDIDAFHFQTINSHPVLPTTTATGGQSK